MQQSRIHPELWRTTTARGNDQHGVRRIDHQPGRQPPVREEAADGLDLARRPSPATDPDEGPERRTGGRIPSMVPAVQSESRVTPDFLMHSIGWATSRSISILPRPPKLAFVGRASRLHDYRKLQPGAQATILTPLQYAPE